jgi:hypothetical protein
MSFFVSFLVGSIFISIALTMMFAGMLTAFPTNYKDIAVRIAIGQIAQLIAIVALLHKLAW